MIKVMVDGFQVGCVESFQPRDRRIEPVHTIGTDGPLPIAGKTFGVLTCGRTHGKTHAMGVEVQRLKSAEFRERGGMGDEHVRGQR